MGTPSVVCDRRPLIEITDQITTSACVGFENAQSIHARRLFLRDRALDAGAKDPGVPKKIAPFSIYTPARAIERRGRGLKPEQAPLVDQGCEPALALEAMQQYGVCTTEDWPFDPALVNAEPDVMKLEEQSSDIIVRMYTIDTPDPAERERALALAVDAGHFPGLGFQTWQAFEDYKSGVLGARNGESFGGHMIGICGHIPDPEDANAKLFYGWNHWSEDWGLEGFFLVNRAFIGSPDVRDISVLHIED